MVAKFRQKGRFAGRLLGGTMVLAALGACGEDAAFPRDSRPAVQGARLTVPTHLTPPVRVESVEGAPARWNLSGRVAQSLRDRDVPAGLRGRGGTTYVVQGRARPGDSGKSSTQLVVEWTLYDPEGNRVGSVSQIAALPNGSGAINDDVVDAIADAAAESISPIIPSANVSNDTMTATGEPPRIKRRQAENRDPVGAVGRLSTNRSGVARNLMTRGSDRETAETAETGEEGRTTKGSADSVTAVGRMRNGSALSRNLMERSGGRPGDSFAAGTSSDEKPKVRLVADAGDEKPAPEGSMEELFRSDEYTSGKRNGAGTDPRGNDERGTSSAGTAQKQGEAGGDDARDPREALKSRGTEETRQAGRDDRSAAQTREGGQRTATGFVYWVQVGAFRTPEEGQQRWSALRGRAPGLLGDAAHRIVAANIPNRGVYHRVQVGPLGDRPSARRLCNDLKAQKIDCFLVRERASALRETERETKARKPAKQESRKTETKRTKAQERKGSAEKVTKAKEAAGEQKEAETGKAKKTEAKKGPLGDDGVPLTTSPGIPGVNLD